MTQPVYPPANAQTAERRRQLAPAIHDAFQEFSRQVFANGALEEKTKQLIAVAVAHVTQCPYCIRGHTKAALRKGASSVVPLADRAVGNLQQWLIGTYHGVSRAQLRVYLDEFVFRHNRRRTPMVAFQTLLGLGTGRAPTPYRKIRGARDVVSHTD